jgi:dihydroorotate dehydrogenase
LSEFRIGHLEVEAPWGNAASVVTNVHDAEILAKSNIGWIEAGPFTPEPREGNGPGGEKTTHYDVATGAFHNCKGMPNEGIEAAARLAIPEMVEIAEEHGKKLVVNVSPTTPERADKEAQELVALAYGAGAHGVLLNAGCPSIVREDGSRQENPGCDPQMLGKMMLSLADVTKENYPVFLRVPPAGDYPEMRSRLRPIKDSVVSVIFATNTKPLNESDGQYLDVPGETGGMSGPALTEFGRTQLGWALAAGRIGGRNIDVVSSIGIHSGEELHKRIRSGAIGGAGTSAYYIGTEHGLGLAEVTDKIITQFAFCQDLTPEPAEECFN